MALIAISTLFVNIEGNAIMQRQLDAALGTSASSPSDGAATTASSPSETPAVVPDDVRPGTCSLGDAAVACDSDHDAEAIGGERCEWDDLVRYFGGRPDIDVLRPDLRLTPTASGSCVVHLPVISPTPVSGMLSQGDGSVWRWCRNSREDTDVACSEPHDQEVVARVSPDSTDELDCESRAGQYMSIGWERVRNELAVSRDHAGPERICVVTPRGDNSLEGTLRDLGTNSLPLGQPL